MIVSVTHKRNLRSLARIVLLGLACSCANGASANEALDHPRLVMTPADITLIRDQLGETPLFDSSLLGTRNEVDAEMANGIDTPIPRDYSGGYTHERHKKNYAIAQKAGALYLILGEEKYAEYVREMLLQYASMYKSLPLHPKTRSYARGKLFWQCLNDANWLVFMSQAYDAIYNYLSPAERHHLETDLFRPFADHISIDSPQFFNRIHNHSTWGTAAVGMIGLVLDDDELVGRALNGLDIDNSGDARDNDGGFIRQAGQSAGFFANLASAFSPDGYYTEGPYYQRYAMYPYLVFAQSLRNADYSEQAFGRNSGVLMKAVYALIELSDADGDFFPLNDAQKGMSLHANELVTAVNVAYQTSKNPRLLDIVEMQNRVLLDGAGFTAARAIADGKTQTFAKQSIKFADGKDGTEGGLAILRGSNYPLTLLFKYTSQGLSHGHYDKLSLSLYEEGQEILQDYGMARFVNLGQKGGGNYLPENATWAKQSIAHNTLTVNATSHFNGQYDLGSQHHSELEFFNAERDDVQVVSARDHNAYPRAPMKRTLALLTLPSIEKPIVLDILEIHSADKNQYDLPIHYFGQIIDTNFDYQSLQPRPLGTQHGYQHLYLEGQGTPKTPNTKFTWMNANQLYTLTMIANDTDELLLTRLGANDPNFNLRRDPSFIVRRKQTSNTVFVSIIEPHGSYDPVTELSTHATSRIQQLELIAHSEEFLAISIKTTDAGAGVFYLARDNDPDQIHRLRTNEKDVSWNGPFHYEQTLTP